jgi:alpha-tubulin suppressor-like RCC1 family protein
MVSAGATSVHAVALRQGTVWGWGDKANGDGTTATRRYAVQAQGLTSVTSVASGSDFSLALRDDGTVWAWGNNQSGQLGTAIPVGSPSGVPVQINGLNSIIAITAAEHCLALRSDGTVWAWGSNLGGALGIGGSDGNAHPIPTQVAGLPGIANVLTGSSFSIALSKDDGSLWVWGNNFQGQLGDGTTAQRFLPVHLSGLPHFKSIAPGNVHVIAVADDSSLWSWGSNHFGQLGLGTADNDAHSTPTRVAGMQAKFVAAGSGHTLIVKPDGTVWAFGNNNKGQLANGGIDTFSAPHPTPNQVPGLNNVTAVFAGVEFSLAMEDTPNGSQVKAWGSNERGTLGDGTISGRTSPVLVIENAVVAAPLFGSPGGAFSQPISVTVSCGTFGATVRFTTNGQDPTLSDPIISSGSPVFVDHPLRLKARAWKAGLAPSGVTSADFNVSPANPIDITGAFVTQHYQDFLARQPDAAGLQFWMNNIDNCGFDSNCREVQRINTSASFFLSIEFQNNGYLVERFYKVAYGDAQGNSTFGGVHQLSVPNVRFNEFNQGTQQIGQGVIVLASGWEQRLETNKQAYALEFVQTARFINAFPTSLTPAQFVDQLNQRAGNVLSAGERTTAINIFGGAADTSNTTARAQVVRQVAEDTDLYNTEYNRAFVLAEYFGYLRRNPNDAPDADYTGYDFWLTKLNQFNGNYINAEMVKAFLSSIEYRQRFGP